MRLKKKWKKETQKNKEKNKENDEILEARGIMELIQQQQRQLTDLIKESKMVTESKLTA
jgi:hypothetical protein